MNHATSTAHINATDIARNAATRAREELSNRDWLAITAEQFRDFIDAEADGYPIDELLWRLACAELVTQRIAAYRADDDSGEPGHYCERGACCKADRAVLDAMRCWQMPAREAAIAAE